MLLKKKRQEGGGGGWGENAERQKFGDEENKELQTDGRGRREESKEIQAG